MHFIKHNIFFSFLLWFNLNYFNSSDTTNTEIFLSSDPDKDRNVDNHGIYPFCEGEIKISILAF